MTFINAIVNTPQDLLKRIKIRQELNKLDFPKVLAALRTIDYDESPELDTQVATYDEECESDEADLKKRFEHIEFPSDGDIYQVSD